MLICLMLSPFFVFNLLSALITRQALFTLTGRMDAVGRKVELRHFSVGLLKSSAVLLQVAKGEIHLCGASFNSRLSYPLPKGLNTDNLPTGLISLLDSQEKTGLSVESPETLLVRQSQFGAIDNLALVTRFIFNHLWFRKKQGKGLAIVPLFGLRINNTRMQDATKWFAHGEFFRGIPRYCTQLHRPRISFFVNANSINLAQRDSNFKAVLNQAHCLFADGSGMRLAAQSVGFQLLDNINGTDALPILCHEMQNNKQRLFLLGALPGIAEKVRDNLTRDFPNLVISGTHHGYFDNQQNQEVIQKINRSNTDVLLVAQGSPLQERWIIEHAKSLDCDSVLAVGGLFDFYSGNIARAPMWMRETGLEWLWRLMQEPVTKFQRYIVGVPEFLFRTYILKQACQE